MKPYHSIKNATAINDELRLIIDEKEYVFVFSNMSSRLSKATRVERETFEVSPAGYGIHWPLLDEDISIDGLLGVTHEMPLKKAA